MCRTGNETDVKNPKHSNKIFHKDFLANVLYAILCNGLQDAKLKC